MALAPLFPDTLMLGKRYCRAALTTGMEIRVSVTHYVADRIAAHRQSQTLLPASAPDYTPGTDIEEIKTQNMRVPGGYKNVSVIRANAMKHLPRFFEKGQVGRQRYTSCQADARS